MNVCLKHARELIKQKEHWTEGCMAVDRKGKSVSPDSESAVAFCALGAMDRTYADLNVRCDSDLALDYYKGKAQLHATAHSLYQARVWEINDYKGHVDVLRLYDEAIKILQDRK